MAFKAERLTLIEVDHEDETHVYMAKPNNIRVEKASGKLESYTMKHGWREQKLFCSVTKKQVSWGSLRFSRGLFPNNKSYSAARVIAVALIPNPNNFKYITFKDHNWKNLHVSNLQWSERDQFLANRTGAAEFTPEELEILKEIPKPHDHTNKEYMYFLNHRKDKDGLTKADRSRLRKAGRYPLNNIETSTEPKLDIRMDTDVTERAMQIFLLSKPLFDPVTHLQKGYVMLTADELETLLKKSTETEAVKNRARELLVEIAKGIMAEACKSDATLRAIGGSIDAGYKRNVASKNNGASKLH